MSGIGYRECVGVVNGQVTVDQAKVQVRHDTRVFVRRQANWFKEGDPSIHWFRVHEKTVEELVNLLRQLVDF